MLRSSPRERLVLLVLSKLTLGSRILRWLLWMGAACLLWSCGGETEGSGESPAEVDGADVTPTDDDSNTPTPDPGKVPDTTGSTVDQCVVGASKCHDPHTAKVCNALGDSWELQPCMQGTSCSAGACKLLTCTPGELLGTCATDTSMEVCDGTGTGVEYYFCDISKPVCHQGECKDLKCLPGAKQCKGVTAIESCKSDGTGFEVSELCGEGGICKNAKCLTACDVNVKQNTYIGCEYWVLDLDNIEGGQYQPIAAVVSNPSKDTAVAVQITNMAEGADLDLGDNLVGPLQQKVFMIPKGYDLDGSVISANSFRLKTNGPVTVHQFNPLNANHVFSNDASLLLPSNSAGKEFYVMSWQQRQADSETGNIPVRGFLSVVAVDKGDTEVSVFPTAPVEPVEGHAPLTPFAENKFTLAYGQVLNLETGGGQSGPDLTGTRIVTNRRVAVFGGHECANVPLVIQGSQFVGAKFCDHIEQQLFPLDTWGTQYVADAFLPRSPVQTDYWRVMAGANQVVVQTDPPQPNASGVTLNKGEFVEFESSESFFIVATGPISVGHYLKSSNYGGFEADPACNQGEGDTGIGDPAFAIAVGTVQFRDDYIVLTPDNYAQHYLNFMYQSGTIITLDGELLELPEVPLGLTNWNVHTVEVAPGVHHVVADGGQVGVTAYGYDCDVSYAYPGGLNLEAQ